MGTIAIPNTFSPNTVISSSQVNANFSTIYNEFNGSIAAANLASDSVVTAKIADSNVTTAKLADAAITPAKLIAGTGTSWVWQDWTPTWANFTVGSSTQNNKFVQIGKTVFCRLDVIMGAGSAMGTNPQFTFPVTAATQLANTTLGTLRLVAGGTGYVGIIIYTNTTTGGLLALGAGGTYLTEATITSTVPGTWGTTGHFRGIFIYEAA